MFRKSFSTGKKSQNKQENIISLTGNNYGINKLDLLKHQLSHYPDKNMDEIEFCHIYANGIVDGYGVPGKSHLKEQPTLQLTFEYKKGHLIFNDITNLFCTSSPKRFHNAIKEMTKSLCLVVSARNLVEFQSIIKKLNKVDRNQVPPIITLANETCYEGVCNLTNKIDLGIAAIIKTSDRAYDVRFEPVNLYYMATPEISCELVNTVWKELTIAIELLISKSNQFLSKEVDDSLSLFPSEVNDIISTYAIQKR